MDLKQLDLTQAADQGATVELYHPVTQEVLTHKDKPVTVTVLGADSTVFKSELKARTRKALGQNKKSKPDLDKAERENAELLAKCTQSWYGIEEDGKRLDCTFENAVRVYLTYPWLAQQVDEAIANRANFMQS